MEFGDEKGSLEYLGSLHLASDEQDAVSPHPATCKYILVALAMVPVLYSQSQLITVTRLILTLVLDIHNSINPKCDHFLALSDGKNS